MRAISLSTRLLTGVCLFAITTSGVAFAQENPGSLSEAAKEAEANVLETVVVTGVRRREEAVQATPVAISALNTELLDRTHASDLKDIGRLIPNLQTDEIAGGGSKDSIGIYLRGFGTSQISPANDPSIPILIDGVASPLVTGSSLDLFSLSGIEVARGPQGTLVGKNAPTGVISVNTLRPTDEWGGKVQLDYGRFNRTEVRGLVNIPIVPGKLAINVSGVKKYQDNWYTNILTNNKDAGGTNMEAARIGALYTPNDIIDWYVTGSYYHDHSPQVAMRSMLITSTVPPFQFPQTACVPSGICTDTPPLTQKFAYASPDTRPNDSDKYTVTSNLDIKLNGVTITSVTGYQRYSQLGVTDFARLPTLYGINYIKLDYNSTSQEIRIASNKGGPFTFNDRLDWVFGGNYNRLHYRKIDGVFLFQGFLDSALGAPPGTFPTSAGLNVPSIESQVTNSYAVFGHLIGKITDAWSASFGFRQSWDDKSHSTGAGFSIGPYDPGLAFGPPFDTSVHFSNTSFEAGTQYKLSQDKMVYFRFAQGYRAGGVQETVQTVSPLFSLIYKPETVNSYEVGVKADWMDKRLRTNLTLFNNDYTNLQRNIVFFLPALTQVISNAARATVQGVELETTYVPMQGLTLHANGGYLHTRYHQYTGFLSTGSFPAGFTYDESLNNTQRFPYTPKWTFNAGFDYTHDWGDKGVTTLSMAYDWRSSFALNDVDIPAGNQKAYGLLNLSLRWEDPSGRYSVTFYGHNVSNTYYRTYFVTGVGGIGTEGMPATWALSLAAKF